jgi:hypothetical protein
MSEQISPACGCGNPVVIYKNPEIINGTWWIGGVDTKVPVAYPPVPGEDGYWYVNGQKTTAKVNVIPTISEDGYWVLDGKKTSVRATILADNNTLIGNGSEESPLAVDILRVSGVLPPAIKFLDTIGELPVYAAEHSRYVINSTTASTVYEMLNGEWKETVVKEGYAIIVAGKLYICISHILHAFKAGDVDTGVEKPVLDVVDYIPSSFLDGTRYLLRRPIAGTTKFAFIVLENKGGIIHEHELLEGCAVRVLNKTSPYYDQWVVVKEGNIQSGSSIKAVSDSLAGDGTPENPLRVPVYYL